MAVANGGDWRPGRPLTLESEHYLLRSLAPHEVNLRHVRWLRDPEVMATLNLRPMKGVPDAQLLKRMQSDVARADNRTRFHLGIFPKEAKSQIGYFAVDLDEKNAHAQTRVVIGEREWWGRDVVIEARAVLIDFLFSTAGVEKVWGSTSSRNIASIFNYRAQGFTNEGILRKHSTGIDGARIDIVLFGLLREEWAAGKGARRKEGGRG